MPPIPSSKPGSYSNKRTSEFLRHRRFGLSSTERKRRNHRHWPARVKDQRFHAALMGQQNLGRPLRIKPFPDSLADFPASLAMQPSLAFADLRKLPASGKPDQVGSMLLSPVSCRIPRSHRRGGSSANAIRWYKARDAKPRQAKRRQPRRHAWKRQSPSARFPTEGHRISMSRPRQNRVIVRLQQPS